jgi:hypothetical protein
MRNTMISRVSAHSNDHTPYGRPRTAHTSAHGINTRQTAASSVPTALARSEFHTSPCMSSAKLVVIPHDGQGSPVMA